MSLVKGRSEAVRTRLVFLHGLGATHASLARTTARLETAGWSVFAPELTSSGPAGITNNADPDAWVAEAAQTVKGELERHPGSPFILLGHSLGGALCAVLLAGVLPETFRTRVRACALLATPAGIDERFLAFSREQAAPLPWSFTFQVQLLHFLQSVDGMYGRLRVPVLVLQGGNDEHIPPESGEKIFGRLAPGIGRYASHPAADHFFVNREGEGSTFLQNELLRFLGDCSAAREAAA